jgi:NTE family protein
MVALVLQGGGALGAYHIGAYEALQEAGFEPDWITGISIGAFNSAVLAGNRPDQRLDRLIGLWEDITRPDFISWSWLRETPLLFQRLANNASSLQAFLLGQPNFFVPRLPSPQFLPYVKADSASYYDTSPMLATLRRYADFDLINRNDVRLSLGATDVERGELKFFNNWEEKITPAHVLASGSLPPGFPATKVNGSWYWDGGCISNTPLEAILQNPTDRPVLVFMIDLWGANGPIPTTMDQVAWRQKQIQYASRTSFALQTVTHTMNLCQRLTRKGPPTTCLRP